MKSPNELPAKSQGKTTGQEEITVPSSRRNRALNERYTSNCQNPKTNDGGLNIPGIHDSCAAVAMVQEPMFGKFIIEAACQIQFNHLEKLPRIGNCG